MLLGVAYAWPTLSYRFGADQALFYYVGREWLKGSVPYRDTFDLKPPGIYLVNALSLALFGDSQTSIRILDVLGMVATGVVASLAVRRSTRRSPGELGVAVLLACGYYFTVFDYWDTAQVEIWEGLCLLGSYALLVGFRSGPRAWAYGLAGALIGAAGLLKLTAVVPALGLVVLCALRGARASDGSPAARAASALKALLVLGAGVALPWALTAAYFASTHALTGVRDMLDVVSHYAGSLPSSETSDFMLRYFWIRSAGLWVGVFVGLGLVAAGLGAARRDRWALFGLSSAALLLVACVLSVVMQKKFFYYHWGVCTGALLVLPLYALRELANAPASLKLLPALGLVFAGFVSAAPWGSNSRIDYCKFVLDVWPEPRDDSFYSTFTGIAEYDYATQERIGRAIRERAEPGDLLHVEGLQLALYAITNLRSPARFVSDVFLFNRGWSKRTDDWIEHQHRILKIMRPRFRVTPSARQQQIDYLTSHGYHELERLKNSVLLERN